jgi:hypothetical protein
MGNGEDTSPATKADIDGILHVLKQKGHFQTLGVPIIIAVITGLLAVGGQVFIARSVKEDEAYGTAIGVARASFYQEVKKLLETIDTSFNEICYFPIPKEPQVTKRSNKNSAPTPKTDKDNLSTALIEYRRHLANAPEGLDDATKAALKKYSEFVSNKHFDIRAESLNDEQKRNIYTESKTYLQQALAALKESSKKPAFTSS